MRIRTPALSTLLLVTVIFALTACGNKQAAPEKPRDAKDTVFGDDIRALEKARSVQDTLNKDKANLDKAVEGQSDSKLPVSTD